MSIRIGGKKISLTAIFGFITGAVGILSTPQALAILPAKVSAVVATAGLVITTLSKALVHDAE